MYYNGQIVWNKDTKTPVQVGLEGDGAWAWSNVNYGKTTHFIKSSPPKPMSPSKDYEVALPRSVEDALRLLDLGLIVPAPCYTTHCCICGGWISSHKMKCSGSDIEIKY